MLSKESNATLAGNRPASAVRLRHSVLRWLQRRPAAAVALGAALVLLVPALVYGPYLPFVDLVGFVGMDSYPPQLSYGPLQYGVFQFTYIGHYALSRLLTDLHVSISGQIPLLYFLEAGIRLIVTWQMLERLVRSSYWRSVGIALGTLAFWDGVFLWGGPLPFSLAATSHAIAVLLVFSEATDRQRNASLVIALLAIASVACHPFALPFILILCALRFLFVPRLRWQTAGIGAVVAVFGYIIVRDSPPSETSAVGALHLLFGLRPHEMLDRIVMLFDRDAVFVRALYGQLPAATGVLFGIMASVHFLGFAVSPYLAVRVREQVAVRFVAVMNCAVGALYFLSCDLPGAPIPEWPQRILTFYSPFTYVAGAVGVGYLCGRIRLRGLRPGSRGSGFAWLIPAGILVFMVVVQVPILRFGRAISENYRRVRNEILSSGIHQAYVVVSHIDDIRPFYLRCVPFLLFSDSALIDRHVLVATEWHFQARHPSRIAEESLDLGRNRYEAEFSSNDGLIDVRLAPIPKGRFPMIEGTDQIRWGNVPELGEDQYLQGRALFEQGVYESALEHFDTATFLLPGNSTLWNDEGVARFKAGDPGGAIADLRNAIKLDPRNPEARANLAKVLYETGHVHEAIVELEDFVRARPDLASARQLLDKARRLEAQSHARKR